MMRAQRRSLVCGRQFPRLHWMKRLSFPHWMVMAALLKVRSPYIWLFVSGCCVPFYWSLCLSLSKYFDYNSFIISFLKSRTINPSILFFFSKIILTIQRHLRFHMHFRMGFFFKKKGGWKFGRGCIESVGHSGWSCHLDNRKSSSPWTWDGFPFI